MAHSESSSVPLLEVCRVSKRFGGVRALEDVSLSINPGESVALMGGNGAGKSTLVNIMTGICQPDSGHLKVDGSVVRFHSVAESRAAGVEAVYQDLALAGNLSASSNLFLGRELVRHIGPFRIVDRRAMDRETVRILGELSINLPGHREAAEGYSGGQRQAVAFARSVYSSSRLLILDEPMAALGVVERENVLASVRSVNSRGIATVLITHNLGDMRSLASRVVVISHGRCVGDFDLDAVDDHSVVSLIMS